MKACSKESDSKRAAREFTARFMTLEARGGSRKKLREQTYADIDRSMASPGGREMLRALVDNYLRGQAPHFSADAAMVFGLYRSEPSVRATPEACATQLQPTSPDSSLFRTITNDDWKQALAMGRRARNSVADQICDALVKRVQPLSEAVKGAAETEAGSESNGSQQL